MKNNNKNRNWPEAEHRDLDPLLSQLGQLKPGDGFADSVMARIDIPAVAIQPIRSRYVSTRMAWALFGGYSVASAACLALLIVALSSNTFQFATLSQSALSAIVSMGQVTASLLPTAQEFLNIMPGILGGLAAMWLVTMISAVGLFRVLNSYSGGRTSLHAIR
jgi:hypothetical protein